MKTINYYKRSLNDTDRRDKIIFALVFDSNTSSIEVGYITSDLLRGQKIFYKNIFHNSFESS